MGRRAGNDYIDTMFRKWAVCYRKIHGLDNPARAREYLGAVRCTLGQRRDLHAGSKSEGKVDQHWPEVYTSREAWIVARAYHDMNEFRKAITVAHYAIWLPSELRPVEIKADAFAMSPSKYIREVEKVRVFLEAWIARDAAAA